MENISKANAREGIGFGIFCKRCGEEMKPKGDYMICENIGCDYRYKIRFFRRRKGVEIIK